MVYLTLTTACLTEQRKSVSSPLIGDSTKEATLLSWLQQSPKKGLTYEKCFVHPRNNYNVNSIFEVLTMFTRSLNTGLHRGASKIPAPFKLLGHLMITPPKG